MGNCKLTNKINILIVTIFFFIFSIIAYSKTGNMLIDFSRECTIPYKMLDGDSLYKDIFTIYGFFGYFINYLLYKILPNINLLLIESNIISYFIVILFYLILKKFTIPKINLIFTLFFIVISVFSNCVFSFVVPYSYSTLWAVFGLYLIIYSYFYKKDWLIYLSLGLLLVTKIEYFILSAPIILFYLIKNKNFNIKKSLLFFIFPFIEIIYILISKITIADIIQNYSYISTMIKTPALDFLYKSMGVFFDYPLFIYSLKLTLIYSLIALISYFLYKRNQKILSYIVLILGLFFFISISEVAHLGIFICIILSLINYKKLKQNDIILLIFTIILCSKSIFALSSALYSNFGYFLAIFYIYRQLNKLLNKNWLFWHLIIFMVFLSLTKALHYQKHIKYPIKTRFGTIYLEKKDIALVNRINQYINKNLKEDDSLIVVPEGQIINLINKKPWSFYNSTFTPLDFQTFGEDNIIQKLKENKTDYIIFYPRLTKEYGAKTICYDYAVDFCSYIMDNYTRVEMFGDSGKILIFRINK